MTKEALKLALEAFNDLAAWNDGEVGSHMDEPYAAEVARRIITAIEEALAQPEQEPWVCECGADSYLACKCVIKSTPHLKPLTDEEIDKAMAENKQKLFDTADNYIKMRRAYARIIEAAHGIKEQA